MSDTQTVTLKDGCLIGSEWKEAGAAVSLPKTRAERLIAQKKARAGGAVTGEPQKETANTPNTPDGIVAFEDAEFPGADVFTEAGILTKDAAAEFIKANGDGWNNHDSMNGIGPATAKKIVEQLGELL